MKAYPPSAEAYWDCLLECSLEIPKRHTHTHTHAHICTKQHRLLPCSLFVVACITSCITNGGHFGKLCHFICSTQFPPLPQIPRSYTQGEGHHQSTPETRTVALVEIFEVSFHFWFNLISFPLPALHPAVQGFVFPLNGLLCYPLLCKG